MPSMINKQNGLTSKSVASIPDEISARKVPATKTSRNPTESKETKTSILNKDASHNKKDQMPSSRRPNATYAPEIPQADRGPASASICAVCSNIGRVLTCCRNLKGYQECKDCSDMALLLAKAAPDLRDDRQLKEDHIESLKLETKQFDEETERLKEVLVQKKMMLQDKRDELYKRKPEGPKILKRLGRAKAAKKKEK